MKEKVIAVFDVGKTNKKILLFDSDLNVLSVTEEKFAQIADDDGFECDDIGKIEKWILDSVRNLIHSDQYDLTAVNFSTYGATLAYIDKDLKRITPVYNYLKPIDDNIPEKIYRRNGGQDEFCRITASPALGMLNSGFQALWLKTTKPEIFKKVSYILHFPQYLSKILTGKLYSEHTSIGCHTALWDFDNMDYHPWVMQEGLNFLQPAPVDSLNEVTIDGKKLMVGIGIHDSSSSLAPYFGSSNGKFLLASTGTWCINMNPFNNEKLTSGQIDRDCLSYLSITRQPVKSSRLFLGQMHDTALKLLEEHFRTSNDIYKKIKPDYDIDVRIKEKFGQRKIFFNEELNSREFHEKIDLFEFTSFEEGYHKLMYELGMLTVEAINLVLPENDETENIYITGGFSKNELFVKQISDAYSTKKVYTSVIDNASALGAAFVISGKLFPEKRLDLNLGLTRC